jgi:cytoskeletal protein CcmA (bactofilin family)
MFSRHNQNSGDDRLNRDESRTGGISPLPSTGMRDAIAVPISGEQMSSPSPRSDAESVVGREDRFEGTLRVQRGLRVLGQISGKIEAATSVTIDEGAKVEADLTADEAIISGEYSGKLVCRQRLEIRSTGLVKGEIETVRLMLHEGGFIDGALHMQKPASAAAAAGESARTGDSLRSGISPRATSDTAADAGSLSTNGSESASEREAAAAGVRATSSGSSRSSSR